MTTQGKSPSLLNFARLRACDPGDVGDLARAWLSVREQPATYELQFDTQIGEESPRPIVVQAGVGTTDTIASLRAQVEKLRYDEQQLHEDNSRLRAELARTKDACSRKIFELSEPASFERAERAEAEVLRLTGELAIATRAVDAQLERQDEACKPLALEVERLTAAIRSCYGANGDDDLTPYEMLDSVEACWKMEHEAGGRAERRAVAAEANLDRLTAERDALCSELRMVPGCPVDALLEAIGDMSHEISEANAVLASWCPECDPGRSPLGSTVSLLVADVLRPAEGLRTRAETAESEVARLNTLINNPHTDDFLESARTESAHQRERWGASHDAGKGAPDWYWLLGYLAGKALAAWKADDIDKLKHHIITTGAACLNWHANVSGADTSMRPGIDGAALTGADADTPEAADLGADLGHVEDRDAAVGVHTA